RLVGAVNERTRREGTTLIGERERSLCLARLVKFDAHIWNALPVRINHEAPHTSRVRKLNRDAPLLVSVREHQTADLADRAAILALRDDRVGTWLQGIKAKPSVIVRLGDPIDR